MEKMIEGIPHITMNEAAGKLETTPVRILLLIRQGVMRGRQVEEEWFVETGSISCFRRYDASPAKPAGCKGSCQTGSCPIEDRFL